jgi:hypothetical protein
VSAGRRQVRGRDIVEGDILYFLGTPHRVTSLEAYQGPLAELLGAGARIAHAGPDWETLLEPDALWELG